MNICDIGGGAHSHRARFLSISCFVRFSFSDESRKREALSLQC